MFGTPQLRAAALSAGFGIVFPTLLAEFSLNGPSRTQVAGSYRFDLNPTPLPANFDWLSPRLDTTTHRGGD